MFLTLISIFQNQVYQSIVLLPYMLRDPSVQPFGVIDTFTVQTDHAKFQWHFFMDFTEQ